MTECKHEWTGKYTGFPANPVELYCPLCGKKMSWTEAMRRLNNYVDLEAENEMLREATNKLSAELDVAQGDAMNKSERMFRVDNMRVRFRHTRSSYKDGIQGETLCVIMDSNGKLCNYGEAYCSVHDNWCYETERKKALALAIAEYDKEKRARIWRKYFRTRGGQACAEDTRGGRVR